MRNRRNTTIYALLILLNVGAFFALKAAFVHEELRHGGTFLIPVGLENTESAIADIAQRVVEGTPVSTGWH